MEIILNYFSDFTPLQLSQFEMLENVYKEWNEKINVISRKDIDGLYEKHVLHSLAIAAVVNLPAGTEVVDLGTGGGFPGIPLAIFFPEVRFHLVDSIAKKLKVVQAVAEATGLSNVTTQHTRVEDIRNRKFDFVVSRAVAPLKDLWGWSKPLLKKSIAADKLSADTLDITTPLTPSLICLKGGDLHQEIQESGAKPRMMEIHDIFPEDFFKEKYILQVSR